nr:MAG TPA: Protein of unknown function (DUF1507) [Caudoviricetes sp.]
MREPYTSQQKKNRLLLFRSYCHSSQRLHSCLPKCPA